MEPVVVTRVIECRSDHCALWPILTDTERLNRAAGMERIDPSPLDGAGAARYLVRTRIDGWDVEYEERPFEWILHERWAFRRYMRGGPLKQVEMRMTLAPTDAGGTRVTLELRPLPRYWFIRPFAYLSAKKTLQAFATELLKVDAELADKRPVHSLDPASRIVQGPFDRAVDVLRGMVAPAEKELAERLVTHVRDGSDFDVGRIRPYELADQWGADRQGVLTVCLAATVSGLLELTWELICPSCRTGSSRKASLGEIPADGHCQLCDLSFGVELDRAVEATFRPARAVREVDEGPYCIGGPARTPHVVAQEILPAKGEAALRVPAEAGRYRLFVRGGATSSVEVVAGGAATAEASFDGQLAPARLEVGPGATIRVRLALAEDRHVKLERIEWASRAASAHHVSMNPTFRRLFSQELLKPGLALKVGRVALLFSDLTASTALYSRQGDATAFRLVQEHFDVLRAVIEEHKGVIVKTIGDAIMASFLDETDAVKAGLEMQRRWPAFLKLHEYASNVTLKVGVYGGPCYAVTANGVLDYFGQTVNVAARLQNEARSGEVVVPAEIADRALAGGWLGAAKVSERFEAALKGLDAPVPAVRLRE